MFNGGRRLDAHLRRRLAADAAVRLPRPLARRGRRRLAARPTTSCCPTTSAPTATSASRAWAATRPTRPAARTRRCRRCRSGRAGSRSPGPTPGSAGTGGRSPTRSCRRRTTGAARASSAGTCQQGCNEGAKASTDLTHWPKAIAAGARLVTGARVRRLETNAAGLATGATWLDRDGGEHFAAGEGRRAGRERDRHAAAAAAVGRRRRIPTASRTRPGSSGKRLMMHPFANVGGPVRRGPRELAGPVRLLDRVVRVLRDRRAARLRPRREVGPRARPFGPINAALPSRAGDADLGPGAPPPRQGAPRAAARTGACSARTCPTRRTASRCRRRSPTRRASPAPEIHYKVSDNSRRLLDFHIEKASRVAARGRRLHGRGRPADALLGLAPARHGAHGRRPDDVGPRPLEPDPRRPQPVRRRRQLLRHLGRGEPDVVDLRARAARRGPHGRDPLRPAGAGCDAPRPPADPLARARRRASARRSPPSPAS